MVQRPHACLTGACGSQQQHQESQDKPRTSQADKRKEKGTKEMNREQTDEIYTSRVQISALYIGLNKVCFHGSPGADPRVGTRGAPAEIRLAPEVLLSCQC